MKNQTLLKEGLKLKIILAVLSFQTLLSAGLFFILRENFFEGSRLLYSFVFIICVLCISAAVVGYMIGESPSYLSKATRMIEKLNDGTFDYKEKEKLGGESGKIFGAIKSFIERLKETSSQISTAGAEIHSNASDISYVIEEQNFNMKTQSDSATQIMTTVEELSASSKQISAYSDQVFGIAEQGLGKAENGVKSIERTMNEMRGIIQDSQHKLGDIVELGKKSQEISSVMGIINSIADQTKLIAFNAALEASSAGEAGKRFGVVAVEIRRLADNVMESTGEIENKISEIQDSINSLTMASEKSSVEMEKGMKASSQTVDILKDILEGAKTNRDAAKQISVSTKQQETASEQVVSALREIASASEDNIDSAEKTVSLARKLSDLSSGLKAMLSNFQFKEDLKDGIEKNFHEESEEVAI